MDAQTRARYDAVDVTARSYGARLDGLGTADNAALREQVARDGQVRVDWTHPQLAKVTVLRLIGACREYPYWDVSYCYGELKNGTAVRVDLPFAFGDLPRFGWKGAVIEQAKRQGVYAKGLGILDNVSMLHG